MAQPERAYTPAAYDVSVVKSKNAPNEWRVEAIDYDDGGVELTLFSGPYPELRAREYATLKYGFSK